MFDQRFLCLISAVMKNVMNLELRAYHESPKVCSSYQLTSLNQWCICLSTEERVLFSHGLTFTVHFNSVTTNAGLRYCLNPNLKAVKKLLANVM